MPSYPQSLPHSVVQLIDELDRAVPPAIIDGPEVGPEETRRLVFQAGRRSLVEELKRLLSRSQE